MYEISLLQGILTEEKSDIFLSQNSFDTVNSKSGNVCEVPKSFNVIQSSISNCKNVSPLVSNSLVFEYNNGGRKSFICIPTMERSNKRNVHENPELLRINLKSDIRQNLRKRPLARNKKNTRIIKRLCHSKDKESSNLSTASSLSCTSDNMKSYNLRSQMLKSVIDTEFTMSYKSSPVNVEGNVSERNGMHETMKHSTAIHKKGKVNNVTFNINQTKSELCPNVSYNIDSINVLTKSHLERRSANIIDNKNEINHENMHNYIEDVIGNQIKSKSLLQSCHISNFDLVKNALPLSIFDNDYADGELSLSMNAKQEFMKNKSFIIKKMHQKKGHRTSVVDNTTANESESQYSQTKDEISFETITLESIRARKCKSHFEESNNFGLLLMTNSVIKDTSKDIPSSSYIVDRGSLNESCPKDMHPGIINCDVRIQPNSIINEKYSIFQSSDFVTILNKSSQNFEHLDQQRKESVTEIMNETVKEDDHPQINKGNCVIDKLIGVTDLNFNIASNLRLKSQISHKDQSLIIDVRKSNNCENVLYPMNDSDKDFECEEVYKESYNINELWRSKEEAEQTQNINYNSILENKVEKLNSKIPILQRNTKLVCSTKSCSVDLDHSISSHDEALPKIYNSNKQEYYLRSNRQDTSLSYNIADPSHRSSLNSRRVICNEHKTNLSSDFKKCNSLSFNIVCEEYGLSQSLKDMSNIERIINVDKISNCGQSVSMKDCVCDTKNIKFNNSSKDIKNEVLTLKNQNVVLTSNSTNSLPSFINEKVYRKYNNSPSSNTIFCKSDEREHKKYNLRGKESKRKSTNNISCTVGNDISKSEIDQHSPSALNLLESRIIVNHNVERPTFLDVKSKNVVICEDEQRNIPGIRLADRPANKANIIKSQRNKGNEISTKKYNLRSKRTSYSLPNYNPSVSTHYDPVIQLIRKDYFSSSYSDESIIKNLSHDRDSSIKSDNIENSLNKFNDKIPYPDSNDCVVKNIIVNNQQSDLINISISLSKDKVDNKVYHLNSFFSPKPLDGTFSLSCSKSSVKIPYPDSKNLIKDEITNEASFLKEGTNDFQSMQVSASNISLEISDGKNHPDICSVLRLSLSSLKDFALESSCLVKTIIIPSSPNSLIDDSFKVKDKTSMKKCKSLGDTTDDNIFIRKISERSTALSLPMLLSERSYLESTRIKFGDKDDYLNISLSPIKKISGVESPRNLEERSSSEELSEEEDCLDEFEDEYTSKDILTACPSPPCNNAKSNFYDKFTKMRKNSAIDEEPEESEDKEVNALSIHLQQFIPIGSEYLKHFNVAAKRSLNEKKALKNIVDDILEENVNSFKNQVKDITEYIKEGNIMDNNQNTVESIMEKVEDRIIKSATDDNIEDEEGIIEATIEGNVDVDEKIIKNTIKNSTKEIEGNIIKSTIEGMARGIVDMTEDTIKDTSKYFEDCSLHEGYTTFLKEKDKNVLTRTAIMSKVKQQLSFVNPSDRKCTQEGIIRDENKRTRAQTSGIFDRIIYRYCPKEKANIISHREMIVSPRTIRRRQGIKNIIRNIPLSKNHKRDVSLLRHFAKPEYMNLTNYSKSSDGVSVSFVNPETQIREVKKVIISNQDCKKIYSSFVEKNRYVLRPKFFSKQLLNSNSETLLEIIPCGRGVKTLLVVIDECMIYLKSPHKLIVPKDVWFLIQNPNNVKITVLEKVSATLFC